MQLLDLKTIIITYAVINFITTLVIVLLWQQNRNRFVGVSLWLTGYLLQAIGVVLRSLAGHAPEMVTIVLANAGMIAGISVLYAGLARFVGQAWTPRANALLLTGFVGLMIYFSSIRPNMEMRIILFSGVHLLLAGQCAWLLLRRVESPLRPVTRFVGGIMIGYALNSLARIVVVSVYSPANTLFPNQTANVVGVVIIQLLDLVLTFALVFMINRRLSLEVDTQQAVLLENAEQYRKAQKLGHVGNWEYHLHTMEFWGSEEAKRIYGFHPDSECLTTDEVERCIPERERVHQALIDLIERDLFYRLEYDIITHDTQERRTIVSLAELEKDADGHPLKVTGVIQDITARKHTEDALAEREAQYRHLTETIRDVIWTLDVETLRFTYVSPSVAHLRGYTPEEIMAEPMDAALTPEHAAYVRQLMEQRRAAFLASETEQDAPFYYEEVRQPCKDGSLVWTEVLTQYTRNPKTGRLEVHGMTRDITARKQAEIELKLNESRLESLLRISQLQETALQPILDFALEEAIRLTRSQIGYIYYYDEAQRRFTLNSWSKAVMPQCTITKPQTAYELDNTGLWGEAVRQRKPIMVNDFHAPNPYKKGYPAGHAPLHKFLTIPVIVDGKIVAVTGVANKADDYDHADVRQLMLLMDSVWNICQRKQVEEALRAAHQELITKNIELHEANASKDKFFSIIAHDLRSPFTGLLGYIDRMNRQADTLAGDMLKDYLAKLARSAKQLYALLENLLAWSRLQRGLVEMTPTVFALGTLADEIVALFASHAEQKSISLTRTIPAAFMVSADHAMVQTILRNLVSNALKFTPAGGRVTLAARLVAPNVEIAVTDTGCGMTQDVLAKLFRIDCQTTTPGTAGETGTGLGLLLCHELVQKHGSALVVESAVGVGTTFRFALPLAGTAAIEPPNDDPLPAIAPVASPVAADLIPPPPAVVRELFDLAQIGDIMGIEQVARDLLAHDAQYAPVATQLLHLRKTCQLLRIRELVEHWLPADA